MENIINVSDIKKLIATAHATLCVVIRALDTKILVGEINRPADLAEKKSRKKRTKKVKYGEPGMIVADMLDSSLPDVPKIKRKRRTKKEIESERFQDVPQKEHAEKFPETIKSLSEDKSSFYNKPKKERKKREEIKPTGPVEV